MVNRDPPRTGPPERCSEAVVALRAVLPATEDCEQGPSATHISGRIPGLGSRTAQPITSCAGGLRTDAVAQIRPMSDLKPGSRRKISTACASPYSSSANIQKSPLGSRQREQRERLSRNQHRRGKGLQVHTGFLSNKYSVETLPRKCTCLVRLH